MSHHITTIEGPDSAGHWGWRCTDPDCTDEASGYEGDVVVAAAVAHGPLAADSLIPVDHTDDGDATNPKEG